MERHQRRSSERSHCLVCAVVLSIAAWGACTAGASAQESPHGPSVAQCDQCHTSSSWKEIARPTKFDHSGTGLPLKGQHSVVQCRACHSSLVFSRTSLRCAECHDDIHRSELGTLCDRCHTPQSWLVADMVQKHARTRFALVGVHAAASCQLCHPSQQKYEYVNVPTDCYGCHAADYQGASNPNHAAAGFSTDCVQCHHITSGTWGTSFDHARTGFTLIGAHKAIPCIQCHAGGNFRGVSALCVSCHQKDYAATSNPVHSPGIPTDCASCHTSGSWRPASFNHAATAFPLKGMHMSTACTSCHRNGVFAGTPMTCGDSGCHLGDYNATTNPVHTSAGFSTECQSCHTPSGWRPATFDHDPFFPISSGAKHPPGRWTTCADCHPVPTSYATFSCIICHSNKAAIDSKHAGRSGYSYSATSCYMCHPRGVAE